MPIILFGLATVLGIGAVAADQTGDAVEQSANATSKLIITASIAYIIYVGIKKYG